MTPKLSVLMPTYKRMQWLRGAIDSVLAPGLDLELLVVDNGSDDGTWDFLQERARGDARLRPVRWEVNQIAEVYPALIEMAQGEYVNFFADDDEMLPGGLARKMDFLDAHPEVGMVFSPVQCMDAEGKDLGEGAWSIISQEDLLGRRDLFASLILGNFVPMPAAMFRRALSPTGVILRDTTFLASNDWQVWLDLSVRTSVAFLRAPTARLRLHGGQVTITSGLDRGFFVEVNLNVWRHWMLQASPPFIPSADAWSVMTRTMYGALQATHGQDQAMIQEGLRRLFSLRDEQGVLLAQVRDAEEERVPEAFLLETGTPWREALLAFGRTFTAEDPVVLAILVDPEGGLSSAQVAKAVEAALDGLRSRPDIRIQEPDGLLGTLRAFPHAQWVGASMEGIKGRRFAEALGAVAGKVQS